MKSRSLSIAALLLIACIDPASAEQGWLPQSAVRALALESLESAERGGPLQFDAALAPSFAPEGEDLELVLASIVISDTNEISSSAEVRVSIVFDVFDEEPAVHSLVGGGQPLGGSCWQLDSLIELPEDFRDAAIVVETPAGWGSLLIEDESLATPGCVEERIDVWRPPSATPRKAEKIVRILPVTTTVRGHHRFRVMTTSEAVRKVVFYLDGEKVAEDDRAPFSANIDLGKEVEAHRIRAEGLTHDRIALGDDEIGVNERGGRLGVKITEMSTVSGGFIDVAARVNLPSSMTLDRVEFYLSEQLVSETEEPPFRARLPIPSALEGTEFVRVVAHLGDGTWIEDVAMLQQGIVGEQVEVHLVEVFVVVTDRDGSPVPKLTSDDFVIKGRRGARYEIERSDLAESVPLSLGLVIDTSGSMWTLMPDTKKAAALFLSQTVTDRDTAFIVDFDTKPRLAQATTSELSELARGLAGLVAEGATAMYDAVIFSSLQFDEARGRRALVLLTDGDDYQSQYSQNRAVEQARAAGAPVYLIALGGFDDFRRSLKTIDVESLTERTGGRVFYVGSMEEVAAAYRSITSELRNQYVIAFSTDEKLSLEEASKIEVEVVKKGLEARVAINPLR